MEKDLSENYEIRFNVAKERIAFAITKGKKNINISGLGLKTIPQEIFEIYDLKELYLGGNQLTDLPNDLANLQELVSINLQKCQFSHFPDVLLKLKNIQSINFSRNKIETIPDSIDSLTELRILILAKNLVNYIPNSIGSLSKLHTLELGGNRISKIPKEMSNLTSLTKIVLVGNPINFPHSKHLKGIPPSQNALFQILHHFINEGMYNVKDTSKVTSRIELPEAVRTAFQQYLIFFNDFMEKAKGIKVDIKVFQYENGLEINYSNSIDTPNIQEYLNEYIGYIRQEIDKINPIFETPILESKQEIFIVELKNQVRHLTGQLEIKRVETNLLEKHVEKLHHLLVISKENPQPIYLNVNSKAISSSSATSNVTINFKLEIQSLQSDILNFKNEVMPYLNEGQLSELQLIDQNLLEIDENANAPEQVEKTTFKRLKRIIEQINNPDSEWNKVVSATKKGVDFIQKIGKQYNKIAPWLAIPSIPEQLLG